MDASYAFAEFAANLKYEDIPEDVVELVKKDIFDMTGNIIAGSSHETVKLMRDIAKAYSNAEESLVAVYGDKAPLAVAAMLNADMAIARDFEDMDEQAHCHPGPVLAPTAITMAAYADGMDGKEFIAAYAATLEIYTRLCKFMVRRNPMQMMGGWDYAIIHGYFSAAIFAARALGLGPEGIQNAMGIVFNQLSGSTMNTKEPSTSKTCGPGFAAAAGVMAAILAKAGLTGPKSFINEHEISMAYQYHAGCDADALTAGLGKEWNVFGLGFKAYPGCRLLHRQIDAAIELAEKNDIKPDEVLAVDYTVCKLLGDKITMTKNHLEPSNAIAAGFSLPWGIACALARRKVTLAEMEGEALADTTIRHLATLCNGSVDEALEDENAPADFAIVTTRGVFSMKTGYPYGSPENPMDLDAIETKFRSNVLMAEKALPGENVERLVGAFKNLEGEKNAGIILKLTV